MNIFLGPWMAFALTALVAPATAGVEGDTLASEKSQSQTVEVELALLEPKTIRLSYRIPASCNQLPLGTPYSDSQLRSLRKSWTPSNQCGSEVNGQIVRSDSHCDRISFDVPVEPTMADRVYPPAFPIGDLGAYVHTSVYAPTDACGPVTWKFGSALGQVVYQGENRGPTVSVPSSDSEAGYMAVFLSQSPLPPGARTALPDDLPLWIRSVVLDETSAIEAQYRKRFTSLFNVSPFVVGSAVSTAGPPRQQAEVADGNMIRYAFYNPPNHPNLQDIANVRGVIAHEYGHRLQPQTLLKGPDDPDNLIHEGGAEYLRWTSMIRLGWSSPSDAESELDKALNTCLANVGDQPWQHFDGRAYGDIPYACGLTLHVLLLASRRDAKAVTADDELESYYRRRKDGPVNFGQAMECGESERCAPRWEPKLLSSTVNFSSTVDSLIRSLGIARTLPTQLPQPLQLAILSNALMHLMDDDCDGSRGYYHRDNGFEVGLSPDCKTFHDGMLFTHANGVRLMAEPLKAARSLVSQCANRHLATLEMSDGNSIKVKCGVFSAPAARFYDLDIRKVLRLLGMNVVGL